MTIQELTDRILTQAKEKGWGATKEEIDIPEKLTQLHSEVSETYEAYRHKKMDGPSGFGEELGDVVTRALHLAGALGIDIESAITKKLDENESRVWEYDSLNERHG